MWKRYLHQVFLYVLVLAITVVTFGPFLFTLSTSFKPPADAFEWPPRLIPRRVTLENYEAVFRITPYFSQWVVNSILIAAAVVVGRLFACSLAGYAFARLDFPGKELLFGLMLGSMIIPGQVLMVPHYLIMSKLRWLDTYYALIVPGIASAFGIFLMTQFLKSIPRDLEEAALLDGCSLFRIYWQVILPLAKPALATLAIFAFTSSWHDFMSPLIYLNSVEKFTLTLGLNFFRGQYVDWWTYILAGAMFANIFPLAIFLVFQRHFVEGVRLTGIK